MTTSPYTPAGHSSQPSSPTSASESGSDVTAVNKSPSQSKCYYCSTYSVTGRENKRNPEEDPEQPLHGWPELAKLIADHPDWEAFQSFKDLNIKSLLYYQAELDKLRKDLNRAEWRDHRRNGFPNSDQLGTRVDYLLECKSNDNKTYIAERQMKLVTRIREVLKEYNAALLQYSQISALPTADRTNMQSLRYWLSSQSQGGIFIEGPGSETWGKLTRVKIKKVSLTRQFFRLLRNLVWAEKAENHDMDLIVPRAGHSVDGLTRWVANEFVPFWENLCAAIKGSGTSGKGRCCGILPSTQTPPAKNPSDDDSETIKPTLNTYSEYRMLRFTSSVATLIACLLPTVAIAVLAQLQSTASLLGMIAGFTAIFAVGLMFLTDAKTSRVEIFTATAAFSAVMVVFVQNQDNTTIKVASLMLNNGTRV